MANNRLRRPNIVRGSQPGGCSKAMSGTDRMLMDSFDWGFLTGLIVGGLNSSSIGVRDGIQRTLKRGGYHREKTMEEFRQNYQAALKDWETQLRVLLMLRVGRIEEYNRSIPAALKLHRTIPEKQGFIRLVGEIFSRPDYVICAKCGKALPAKDAVKNEYCSKRCQKNMRHRRRWERTKANRKTNRAPQPQ